MILVYPRDFSSQSLIDSVVSLYTPGAVACLTVGLLDLELVVLPAEWTVESIVSEMARYRLSTTIF